MRRDKYIYTSANLSIETYMAVFAARFNKFLQTARILRKVANRIIPGGVTLTLQ
jgi:hypothetical protein